MTDTGFSRPTLSELIARVESDFNTRLPGADSRVRRSVLSVLARVIAGLVHGLYGYLDFIARQAIVDTAEVEYLERWGAVWGITRKSATKATGTMNFTGTAGAAINIGTELERGDGVRFLTTTACTISGGTGTATVEAEDAGEDGNTDDETLFTFVSPISGVDAEATSDELTSGTDTESDDDYRERILARIQQPPHGGASFDYVNWALAVSGVTRAWCYPLENGAGTVVVRFMMDDTYDDGIPEAADVTEVQTYIDERRPVTADVTVAAPTAAELDFTIELLDSDGDTVTATGVGTVSAVPNEAQMSFGVETRGQSARAAVSANSRKWKSPRNNHFHGVFRECSRRKCPAPILRLAQPLLDLRLENLGLSLCHSAQRTRVDMEQSE